MGKCEWVREEIKRERERERERKRCRDCPETDYCVKRWVDEESELWKVRWTQKFQHTLLVESKTLVTCLKSTLLLKIKCLDMHIYNDYKQIRYSII